VKALLERMPDLSLAAMPQGWFGKTLARLSRGTAAQSQTPQWRQTAITRGLKELMISY